MVYGNSSSTVKILVYFQGLLYVGNVTATQLSFPNVETSICPSGLSDVEIMFTSFVKYGLEIICKYYEY